MSITGSPQYLTPSLAVVAFKRCVDYVHLAIDMELVRGFGEHLSSVLSQKLGVLGSDADQRCREYLAEPEDITKERNELRDHSRGWKVQEMS